MSTSSAATSTTDPKVAGESTGSSPAYVSPLIWCGVVLALLPVIFRHSINLWNQPYSIAIPAIYVGLVIFLWRLRKSEPPFTGKESSRASTFRRWGSIVFFILGFALFAFSALAASPYLGQVSAVLFLGSFLLSMGNRLGFLHIATVMAFFGLTAIPLAISQSLESYQSNITTWSAAGMLETLAVPNLASGMMIETSKQVYYIPQVCYGFESLLLMLCVAGLLTIWKPQSLAVLLITFFSLVVCALLADTLRIVVLACFRVWGNIDLQTGVANYIYHYVTIALMALMAASVVNFVRVMLETIPRPRDNEEPAVAVKAYNSLVGWPLQASWKNKSRRIPSTSAVADQEKSTTPGSIASGPRALAYLLSTAVMLVLSAAFSVFWFTAESLPASRPFGADLLSRLPGEKSLDRVTLGYAKINWEREQRHPRHPLGQYSHIWQTESPEANISLDFLLPSYLPLAQYFGALGGWEVKSSSPWSPSDMPNGPTFIEAEMKSQDTGLTAYLIYGDFDRSGALVGPPPDVPPAGLIGGLLERLRSGPFSMLTGTRISPTPPVAELYQLRYMITSQSLKDVEKDRARRSFAEIFKQLREETIAAELK